MIPFICFLLGGMAAWVGAILSYRRGLPGIGIALGVLGGVWGLAALCLGGWVLVSRIPGVDPGMPPPPVFDWVPAI